MKKTITILALFMLLFAQSCTKENESEFEDTVYCNTPPSPFLFELVNKATGENVFANGTFSRYNIKVVNTKDQSNVSFEFLTENGENIIGINSIGWKTEILKYSIQLSNETIFNLSVNAERLFDDGCSFTRYKEIKIENAEYEFNKTTEIYKILLD